MRVRAPDRRRWWVGRRWLPWRPRLRAAPGGIDFSAAFDGDDVFVLVLVLLFALPILLFLTLFAVEWLLVLGCLPLLFLVRLVLRVPWPVVARSRDDAGARIRCATEVRGWRASRDLIRVVADEIRRYGRPRSLPAPVFEDRVPTPDAPRAVALADPIDGAPKVVCRAMVHGTDSRYTDNGWLSGWLIVEGSRMALCQDPQTGLARREIPVQGCRGGAAAHPDSVVRRRMRHPVVVGFTGGDGRAYRIAVDADHRHVLDALLPS